MGLQYRDMGGANPPPMPVSASTLDIRGLPDSFDIVLATAAGKSFVVDLAEVVSLTREKPLSQITPMEALSLLEKIGKYRVFLWASYVYAREAKARAQDRYDIWWAEKWELIEARLRTQALAEVTAGQRTKSNVAVTKDAISTHIQSRFRDEYLAERERLNAVDNRERAAYGWYNAVNQFGMDLGVIIREGADLLWKIN